MNCTSTRALNWQRECDEFVSSGKPFELQDVSAYGHWEFVWALCVRSRWTAKREGTSYVFSPPKPK
jgi:hypothetical protein